MNSTPTYAPPGHQHMPGPPPPSGPCGLNAHEWHMFLTFVMLLLFVFLIALVVAWVRSEDIFDMWLQATRHVHATKMVWYNDLLKHVLPQRDVGVDVGLITPGPSVGARSYSTVNIILAMLFPSMRHQPGP